MLKGLGGVEVKCGGLAKRRWRVVEGLGSSDAMAKLVKLRWEFLCSVLGIYSSELRGTHLFDINSKEDLVTSLLVFSD